MIVIDTWHGFLFCPQQLVFGFFSRNSSAVSRQSELYSGDPVNNAVSYAYLTMYRFDPTLEKIFGHYIPPKNGLCRLDRQIVRLYNNTLNLNQVCTNNHGLVCMPCVSNRSRHA